MRIYKTIIKLIMVYKSKYWTFTEKVRDISLTRVRKISRKSSD